MTNLYIRIRGDGYLVRRDSGSIGPAWIATALYSDYGLRVSG